ncbi:S-layer homology domain-containing protein [Paenibacillus psychroresistens]|uniref:S-layer homology domain-containing protein n=1 Tax=Paenibacillus psychroresistens TaxID=1778678 RepID=A0A6B8RN43_9BACL|nr:S-layer homology domain-containing protein [Paenibacillus psychroresistens]QGQ97184.1 S-layer homology domain-containing protein [Paenibacillus psychroresistens]
MNALKKINLSLVLLITLSSGIVESHISAADTTVKADAAVFSDAKSHWAKATIAWATEKKIVNGYPDGTFKPDLKVKEAEFLTMFANAFGFDAQSSKLAWPEPTYNYLSEFNFPIKGAIDKNLRTAYINRLQVAEIITGANGVNFTGNNAIQYILGKKLSNGKVSPTISGYMGTDNLTRAEAVTFIKNLLDQGMSKLLPRPQEASAASLLPALPFDPTNLPPAIATAYTKLQAIIKNYPGFNVTATADHIGIAKDGNKFDSVIFKPANIKGQVSITQLFGDGSSTSISLAVELLKAQGLEIKEDFAAKVKSAMNIGEKATVTVGKIEILIAPSPDVKDNVEFWYAIN